MFSFGKKTVLLKISGMHCPKCSAKVENAMKELGGNAKIDLKLGRAEVKLPKSVESSAAISAIEALGFGAEEI